MLYGHHSTFQSSARHAASLRVLLSSYLWTAILSEGLIPVHSGQPPSEQYCAMSAARRLSEPDRASRPQHSRTQSRKMAMQAAL